MYKLSTITIVLLLLVGISGGVYYVLHGRAVSPQFALTTTSPDQTYTVELKEQVKELSAPPSGEAIHTVWMNVLKERQLIIKDAPLYGGDGYDDRFQDLFPKYEWISNSTIRFANEASNPDSPHDEINIYNETNKGISYLNVLVEKGEMFVLIDVQPKSITRLIVHPQTDRGRDYSWIHSTGIFKDGGNIPEYGVNFKVRGLDKGPAHYCIDIKDSGLNIMSEEFEGYGHDTAGVETRVTGTGKCISP